jgi:hypothetical protein
MLFVEVNSMYCMLLIRDIFLKSVYEPTNVLNKIQFMTSIKLLHVSAPGCHQQGAFYVEQGMQVQHASLGGMIEILKS